MVHEGETVVPKAFAPEVRQMFGEGGGRGGGGGDRFEVNISAVDGQSMRRLLMREGSAIMKSLKARVREGATLPSGVT
jgi:hypothetical protein